MHGANAARCHRAHFGIVAHGLLGMQGIQSCEKYDVLLEH